MADGFTEGSGSVSYAITGMPASGGTASFAISIGGKSCNLDVTVLSVLVCRAKVTATDYKTFLCYNLGAANTSADPYTPSWEITGGYWQWGRLAQAAAGPTGPDAGDANSGSIGGWNTSNPADGSWIDGAKTAADPCPAGYRVPSRAQWEGVIANNTLTDVGAYNVSATNYGVGKKIGTELFLPASGYRHEDNGSLVFRGGTGYYWSSSKGSIPYHAESLYFYTSNSFVGTYQLRRSGMSVRCIAE
jgi:uncharacterized protein (TIGR02145 family)